MIFIAGMTIAVFFEFLLIGKKNKSRPEIILILWMFLITLHLFIFYLWYSEEIYHYPFLLGVSYPFPLLHGVFLYLYVGTLTNQLPKRKTFLILHAFPAVVMYLFLIPFFVLSADEKISIFKSLGAGYELFRTISTFAVSVSGIVYIVWSSLLLRNHRRRILDRFSYQHKIDLQWLQILTWGMGGIWLLVLFTNDTVIFMGVVVFVFMVGFFGIRQARIFPATTEPMQEDEVKEKYAKSGLSDEQAERLYRELTRLMTGESMYKKSELSVDDLATRLNVHSNTLSQVINEKAEKNFYDFVNHYRLEEFKRMVSDPKNRNLTLMSLAFDCGFNSKSSFNRHFKKITGQTPSEYIASVNTP
ncbi:MAG: helix-turn-helix domain-containing protein [Bacteroidota bacterium]